MTLAALPTRPSTSPSVADPPTASALEVLGIIGEGLASQPRSRQTRSGPSEVGHHPCARRIGYKIAGTLDRIRRDDSRTEAWKRQEIARTYRRMCQARDRLIEAQDDAQRKHQRELEGALFGAPATSGDPASWAISRRDAGDRVAQIKTPTQAAELLARAERTNDEPLARAVAERAYQMDWADVANAFLDSRPHLEDRFTELWSQAKPSLQRQFHDAMVFQAKPKNSTE